MLVAASLLLIINKLFPSFLVPTILVFSVLGLIIQYAGNYNYFEDPFGKDFLIRTGSTETGFYILTHFFA